MDSRLQLLAAAREADVERSARQRRLTAVLETCRRSVLGLFPVKRACEPCTSC